MSSLQVKLLQVFSRYGISEALYYGPKRKEYLSEKFLLSDNYKHMMQEKASPGGVFNKFLNDAEDSTENYQFRHHPHIQKQLGSWRWKGMYQYRETLVPIIFRKDSTGVDLGGAYGPVSKDATIVDFAKQDIFRRPVRYKYLDEIDFTADFIFASHTLEHIPDLDNLAKQIKRVLIPGGDLVILVPAYSCISWRVGNHTNQFHNDHVWTFSLADTNITEPINNLKPIDSFLEQHFDVYLKAYTGDNSILILAKNSR